MAGVNQLAQTPELRTKLMWTVLILCAYRVGVHVPVPGINIDALSHFFASMQGSVFALLDMFSGGGLRNVSVFALGIMPYISASIILQLLQVVSPDIKRMAKEEGQAGRRKITQYTRYLTVLITIIQGFGIAALLEGMTSPDNLPVVQSPGWEFKVVTIITLTAGTILIMWLGEQITAKGIGNGISLIIFSGIVVGIPTAIGRTYEQIRAGDMNVVLVLVLLAGMLAVLVGIVFVERSQRRIPIHYAKRQVGRKMYGGQTSNLPMKVNMSGVLPIIFAQSIATIPATIGAFLPAPAEDTFGYAVLNAIDSKSVLYLLIYFVLIIGFSYFYASIQFNPVEISNNLKRNGGFIPGFRPGRPTSDFISRVLNKITLFGALYLGIVAILPLIADKISTAVTKQVTTLGIGGTSVIIVVGVALETVKALENQMLMRQYKGFLD